MTLNGVMAITLRYFSEFGKPVLQKTICGWIYARVCCIFSACTMSSQRKFTFAISSPDEFLVCISNNSRLRISNDTTSRRREPKKSRVRECLHMTTIINKNKKLFIATAEIARVECTQKNGHYAVWGHSRSPTSVPIESPYAISY